MAKRLWSAMAAMVLGACGQNELVGGGEPGQDASEELAVGVAMLPSSDVRKYQVEGVGDPAALYRDVDDGVGFSAADDLTSYVKGLDGVQWAAHTIGFSGGPAGQVTKVLVKFRAQAGTGAGVATATLLSGDTQVAVGPAHALALSWSDCTDSFDGLTLADANQLRVKLQLQNTRGAGALRYTQAFVRVVTAAPPAPPPVDQPPAVAIASPVSGATFTTAQTVTVTVEASDDHGVAQVALYEDGALLGTATVPPYTFPYPVSLARNGAHSLSARATDTAGQLTSSSSVAVTVSVPVDVPIARKASVSRSASGSSLAMSAPAGTTAGDYLVAQVVVRGATGGVTAPDGSWSKLAEGTSPPIYQAVYGRAVQATGQGGGQWTLPSTAGSVTVSITGFSGVSSASAVRGAPAVASGANELHLQPASLSGLTAGDEALVFLASAAGPRPWADEGTLFGVIPIGSIPGGYVDLKTLHDFEASIGRKVAYGHSWLPWNFGAGLPAASTGKGPNTDLAEGRLVWTSWPSEGSWPWGGAGGDGDPTASLTRIANGEFDDLLANNARVLKAFGQPLFFRLFCEMNGGDHPWEVGHQTSPALTATNYTSAFSKAWRRIYVIIKGTAAQAAANGFAIAPANLVHADNVLVHWNPQTFQTTSLVSWDDLWPGDEYVDFAGTENYLRNQNFSQLMHDTGLGNGTHSPLYPTYGPGGSRNQKRGGLMGNGEGGSDVPALIADYSSATDGLPAYPGWKFYTWWNHAPHQLGAAPVTLEAAVQTWLASPYMTPRLSTSFDVPASWSAAYQYRFESGLAAGVNAGPAQSGSMLLHHQVTSTTQAAPVVDGYGFGAYSAITLALQN